MTAKEYTVYALTHPVTKQIRYIGYTSKSLKERLRYHYYDLTKNIVQSHKTKWLQSLKNEGLIVDIITLQSGIPDLKATLDREVFYISQYDNLVNSTSGGEQNKVFSDEVRAKIGNSMRGKLVGALNPMFGKKRPDLKQRNLTNNPVKSQLVKDKLSQILTEKYNTPEYYLIHRQSQKTCKAVKRMDFEGNTLAIYSSMHQASIEGYGRKEITNCCNGISRQHKGFLWAFISEEAA